MCTFFPILSVPIYCLHITLSVFECVNVSMCGCLCMCVLFVCE